MWAAPLIITAVFLIFILGVEFYTILIMSLLQFLKSKASANINNAVDTEIIKETKVVIDESVRKKLLSAVEEQSQVIVHCRIDDDYDGTLVRIWPTTYLKDISGRHKSHLLHAEGISIAPIWTEVPPGKTHYFTLLFSPLPKNCKVFDFFEQIPEPGGFIVRNIPRNKEDVYHIDLTGK